MRHMNTVMAESMRRTARRAACGVRCAAAAGLAAFSLALCAAESASPARVDVKFRGGRMAVGEILKETAETIYLDLGFTVLVVPRKEVLDVSAGKEAQASSERKDIYFVGNLAPGPIKRK